MKDKFMFTGLGELLKPEVVAASFYMTKQYVMENVGPKGNALGFYSKFLMKKASNFVNEEKWDSFKEVLALLIYGIILFPNIDDFFDMPAICVFLTQNLAPMLLEEIYYYLILIHEKKSVTICVVLYYYTNGSYPTFQRNELSWKTRLILSGLKE